MSTPPDDAITGRPFDDLGRPHGEFADRPAPRRPRREAEDDEDYPRDPYEGRFFRRERPADRSARFVAALLDGFLGLLAAGPGLAAVIYSQTPDGANYEEELLVIGYAMAGVGFLAVSIYQWVLLSRQGQTIGKRVVGIRIVRYEDGRNPGFGKAVALRAWVPGLIGNAPYVGGCFSLLDVLFIFGEEWRCLHDLMAGTKVIKVGSGGDRPADGWDDE